MKIQHYFLMLSVSYVVIHAALAADAVPDGMRSAARKIESEELTALLKVALTAVLS